MGLPAKSSRGVPAPLTEKIREAHEACEWAAQSTVKHGIECGEFLIEAKAKVKHGEWMPYLEENFPHTPQTASAYMRIAKNRKQIESAGSIRGALKQLAAPKAEPESAESDDPVKEIAARVDAGEIDWAEAKELIWESLNPFERYWLTHQGIVSTAEKVGAIEETCEIAGVMPMIEDLSELDQAISYVWVGYVTVDRDALLSADSNDARAAAISNPLTYHPGWAHFCRDRLGDGVQFAAADLMPTLEEDD